MMAVMKTQAIKELSAIYHAHPAVSASKIKAVLKSARHYHYEWVEGNRKPPTEAMAFGTMAHTALLEPRMFLDNYVIQPEFKGTGSRKAKEDWLASLPDAAIVMDKEESDSIVGMIKSLQDYPPAVNILRGGIAEHSIYFTDEATGLPCKMRPDYLTESGYIVDLKTTVCSERTKFTRDLFSLGYHISVAHYLQGYKQVFGKEAKGYVFLAVEKKAPFVPSVFVADATIIEKGMADCRKGIDRIKQCMDTDVWPGYQTEAENISLPHYALYEEIE